MHRYAARNDVTATPGFMLTVLDARRFLTSPVALITAMVVVACWALWQELAAHWSLPDDPYSHGWLTAVIIVVLLFIQNRKLDYSNARPYWLATVPLLGALLGAYLLHLVNIQSAQALLLPFIFWFAFLTVLGWRLASALLFPVFFLFFALPVWGPVVDILQDITTRISALLLGLANISLVIDGNTITVPAGSFEVADGCSGLKYFLTSCTLATLYAWAFLDGARKRIKLIVVGVALAMLTNWIRVTVIVVAGQLTAMKHPLVADHDNFGWILYAFSLIPFYWYAHRLSEPPAETTTRAYISPYPGQIRPLLIAAIILLPIPLVVHTVKSSVQPDFKTWTSRTPPTAMQSMSTFLPWKPSIHASLQHSTQTYSSGISSNAITQHTYWFGKPWLHEIRDYRDDYFPHPWNVITDGTQSLEKVGQANRAEIALHNRRSRQLVFYWYTVGERTTSSVMEAKLLQMADLMKGKYGAAMSFVSMACDDDCQNAEHQLIRYISNMDLDSGIPDGKELRKESETEVNPDTD